MKTPIAFVILFVLIGSILGFSLRDSKTSNNSLSPSARAETPSAPLSSDIELPGSREVVKTSHEEEEGVILESTPAAAAQFITSKVVVKARDGIGSFPSQMTFSVKRSYGEPELKTAKAFNGQATFELAPGEWLFMVTNLGDGYLEPSNQEAIQRAPEGVKHPEGHFATLLTVPKTGGNLEVTLRIFQEATATGQVVGPQGEGIANVFIRFQATNKFTPGVSFDTKTGRDGMFKTVGIIPGSYVVTMWLDEALPEYREMTRPNKEVEIYPGDNDVQVIEVGRDGGTLLGRVVDEHDLPFAGRIVKVIEDSRKGTLAPLAFTKTDEDGLFKIENLPEEKLLVILSVMKNPKDLSAEGRVIVRKEGIQVDMRTGSQTRDLGDVQVERSHPFIVKGKVSINRGFKVALGMEPDWLQVSVSSLTEEEAIPTLLAISKQRPTFTEERVEVHADGTFTWWCETPHVPVVIIVQNMDYQTPIFNAVEFSVVPTADTTQEVAISWPEALNPDRDL